MMRVLVATSLYPNSAQQDHGLFVENRLRHLLAYQPNLSVNVIAPVPWFPSKHSRFGKYAAYASVPYQERRHGIDVFHPRYLVVPKIGMTLAVLTIAYTLRKALLERARDGWECDVIDAHYFFPDGVAATLVGSWFNKPVVITARGTDINLIPQFQVPRRLIQWAAQRCSHMVTVCEALREALIELGAEPRKVTTLRNGVDLQTFRPWNKTEARERLGLPSGVPIILSVGHLVERKGHHLVIDAMAELENPPFLLIAGEGEQRSFLEQRISRAGLGERVRLLGSVSHEELPLFYSAADTTVLASSREGMANVLLESIACGTPVAATRVWGTPEIIADPVSGRLIESRDPISISRAVRELMDELPAPEEVRRYAERFSWEETSRGQMDVFTRVLHQS